MKRFLLICFSCLMIVSGIGASVSAFEINFGSKDKNVIVDVYGNGEVILEESGKTHKISKKDSFVIENDTELNFTVTANKDSIVKKASVNGNILSDLDITSGCVKTFNFKHSFKNEPLHYVFEFETHKDNSGEINIEALNGSTINDETIKVLDDYKNGNLNKPEYFNARKTMVKKINAQKYVDKDYFMTEKLLEDYKYTEFISMSEAAILLRPDFYEEHGKKNEIANNDERIVGTPTVTYAYHVIAPVKVQFDSQYMVFGEHNEWQVNGRYAWCAESWDAPPKQGEVLEPPVEITDPDLRKVMYYGLEGPEDLLSQYYPRNKAALIMSDVVSTLYSKTSLSSYKPTSDIKQHASYLFTKHILVDNGRPAPPEHFKVYLCDNLKNYGKKKLPDGSWDYHRQSQPLMYWEWAPQNGKVQLMKESANPEVTNGNDCYSLNGAEYGVYSSSACDNNDKLGVLKTNDKGVSNILELKKGTYYIKEIKAPKGYELDETVHTVVVESDKTSIVKAKDEALLDPVTVMLKKVDADTGQAVPVGDGSLADAHYEVLFYGGEYADGIDPATLGVKPTRQWMIKTDVDGYASLESPYLVNSYNNSKFYLDNNGNALLPNGTITVQEKKAPNGYHLDDTKFVMLVRYNNTSGGVSSYNIPIQKEKSVSLKITKVQEFFKDVNLSGVTFKHIKPDGTESFVTTDTNGNIDIKGLVPGTHKICETQTVAGFVVNSDELVFNVEQNGKITVVKAPSFMSYGIDGNGNLNTTIENAVKNIDFQIVKKNENGVLLANAKFGLYSDAGCNDLITELVTNEQGVLNFADYLKANTNTHYYLKELDAPDGYRIPVDLDGSVHVYDICVKRFIPTQGVLEFSIDGKNYDLNTNSNGVSVDGGVENPTIVFDVINYTGTQLPITGANTVLMYSLVGLAIIMVGAIVLTKNAKTSNKH